MKKTKTRMEEDSIGKISVPQKYYWGAQTERARLHFKIGEEKMPQEMIRALALVKKAAAFVNSELGLLKKSLAKEIMAVCDEIIVGRLNQHFPLNIWQSGSGTQTNMNINEVIANRAIEKLGGKLGSKTPVHPNDDVNMSQSTNDVFPTAMHIAATIAIKDKLKPSLKMLYHTLNSLSKKFRQTLKVGRTHLQDAVPMTLGEEFSGYAAQVEFAIQNITLAADQLKSLAIGGTAVGTGLNAPPNFDRKMVATLTKLTGVKFKPAPNKFWMLSSHEPLVMVSGAIKSLATALFKIANDIRLLSSGPRCGLGELILPANEPGSSIMPGKINPTQCEMLLMVCAQIIGNDSVITVANLHGDLELNIFKPVIIYNLLQAINLLSDAIDSFTKYALVGMTANKKRLSYFVENSVMVVAALNPIIGYDNASRAAKFALAKNISIREAVVELGYLKVGEFDEVIIKMFKG